MAVEHEEDAIALRPVKGPVTPVPKAELVPAPRISVSQSALLGRLAPSASVEPDPSEPPAAALRSSHAPAADPAAGAGRAARAAGAEDDDADAVEGGAAEGADTPRGRAGDAPGAPAGRGRTPARPQEPWGRRPRTVEAPQPVERRHAPREFYVPEWDRYYNPGFLPGARIPQLRIDRAGAPPPDAPAWMLVGRPRGMGQVAQSRAPYRASLKEGARVKSSRPRREVERFLAQRPGTTGSQDLEGPAEVPEDPRDAGGEGARREEFERALADLESSFQSDGSAAVEVPARAVGRVPPPASPRAAGPHPDVEAAASRAMPAAASSMRPAPRVPARPVARRRGDEASEEDESEISPGEEEEGTIGRRPPPDRLQEGAAHQALAHDTTGASLCPTCGRRVSPSNPVLVCTSCGRVACASCGKFSAGEPTGNIYQYEYRFNFPLCHPCFERHYTVQKNLARGRAYLSSGNLTYAFYHAQTALKSDADGPYAHDAADLIRQVEQRRSQIQRADKEWEEARKKIMRERTSVLR